MADEPLMSLAMLVFNMKPLSSVQHLMRYYHGNMMETLHWDMDQRDCSFYWWGEVVHPYIVHYATYNTWTLKYWNLSIRIKDRYRKVPGVLTLLHLFFADVKWLMMPRQRKQRLEWLKTHLSKEYFRAKKTQLLQRFSNAKK